MKDFLIRCVAILLILFVLGLFFSFVWNNSVVPALTFTKEITWGQGTGIMVLFNFLIDYRKIMSWGREYE